MDISNASTLLMATLTAALRTLPPAPDDVVVHAHPTDIVKGLLGFLAPPACHMSMFHYASIPVLEDKACLPGKALLWNKTKGTVSIIPLTEEKC